MKDAEIWQAALGELQLQMTRETFNTWLKPTQFAALDNGTLTIRVENEYVKEWLSNRLLTTIQRTVNSLAEKPTTVKFVIGLVQAHKASLQPGDVLVKLIESPTVPFIRVSMYSIWYWQPLLGTVAFSTWEMLRTQDHYAVENWGKRHRLSVEIIAETLQVHRQAITGVQRKRDGRINWQPGAFDVLNEHKITHIIPLGKGRDTVYDARVLNTLPMLAPEQLKTLPRTIQERHAKYLRMFEIDHERWEQLEFPSLVPEYGT